MDFRTGAGSGSEEKKGSTMKKHFAKFQITEDGIQAFFPACGSPPIFLHERQFATMIKDKVTCEKCILTKAYKDSISPIVTKIINPAKMWSPCWYDQGADHCPVCDKGKDHEGD